MLLDACAKLGLPQQAAHFLAEAQEQLLRPDLQPGDPETRRGKRSTRFVGRTALCLLNTSIYIYTYMCFKDN